MTRALKQFAVVLTVAGVVALVVAWVLQEPTQSQPAPATRLRTAKVEVRDMAETEELQGSLTFEDAGSITAARGGVVTQLPPEGTVVELGGVLYEIDGKPVRLMYGQRPMWRSLRRGTEGPDVRQLEESLTTAGFGNSSLVIDDEFDSFTRAAVERWQKTSGQSETGIVEPGEVEFRPGAIRIAGHAVSVGETVQPGHKLYEATSSTQIVELDVDAARQDRVAVGMPVEIELPAGDRVTGTVSDVAKVAETQGQEGQDEGDPTVKVKIALTTPVSALDKAPVDVRITRRSKKDALAVPVEALVALREGGFAVELIDDGRRKLVAVETGLFAEGYVEISGNLKAGDTVAVPL